MAVFKLFFCVAILAASLKDVRADISKEDIAAFTQELLPHITACSQEFKIDGATLEATKKYDASVVEGLDSCFYACVGKKMEMIKDGKFDTDKALATAKEFIKDADDLKNAEEAINDCSSVNSEDGDECARAKSLVSCLSKHKGKFNLA